MRGRLAQHRHASRALISAAMRRASLVKISQSSTEPSPRLVKRYYSCDMKYWRGSSGSTAAATLLDRRREANHSWHVIRQQSVEEELRLWSELDHSCIVAKCLLRCCNAVGCAELVTTALICSAHAAILRWSHRIRLASGNRRMASLMPKHSGTATSTARPNLSNGCIGMVRAAYAKPTIISGWMR